MKTVIIKLYASPTDYLFHDIRMDIIKESLPQLIQTAKDMGSKLCFHYLTGDIYYASSSTAEILFTGALSEEEKEGYLDFLKKCSISPVYENGTNEWGGWSEVPTLSHVRFLPMDESQLLVL